MASIFASLRGKSSSQVSDGPPAIPMSHSTNIDGVGSQSNSGQKVFVGGYLMKRGLGLAVWQRRFFLFRDSQLEYRKTPKSTEILGIIPLRRFDIVSHDANSKDFEIHTPGRIYYLRGENLQSKVNWVNTLLAHQKSVSDFPMSFSSTRDPAAGSMSGSGSSSSGKNQEGDFSGMSGGSSGPTTTTRRVASPVPVQASIHCGICKESFSVSRSRHFCDSCGYAYCGGSQCYSTQSKICSICRVGGPATGTLSGALAALEASQGPGSAQPTSENSQSVSQGKGNRVLPGGMLDASGANLLVRVVEARDLRGADRSVSRDPYAVLFVGNRRFQTKTCHRTLFPWWNEDYSFPLSGVSNRTGLQIAIFDEDKHTTDAFLGMVYLPIAMFRKDTHIDAWFALQPRPSDATTSSAGSSSSTNTDGDMDLDDPDAPSSSHSSESAAAAAAAQSGSWLRRKDTTDVVSGAVHLQIVYSYSPTSLLEIDDSVKSEPPLSKKTLATNVRRMQRIIAGLQIKEWKESYRELMMWRRPFRTLFAMLIYCFAVLYFPVRLVPAIPFLLCLFYLSATYVDRRFNRHSFPLVYEPDDGSSWTDASLDAMVAAEGEEVDEDDLISEALANAIAPYASYSSGSSVEAISASTHAAVIAKRRSLIPKNINSSSTDSTADVSYVHSDSDYDYTHYEDQNHLEYDNDEEDDSDAFGAADNDSVSVASAESVDEDIDELTGAVSPSLSQLDVEQSGVRSRRSASGAPPSIEHISITNSPDSILISLPQAADEKAVSSSGAKSQSSSKRNEQVQASNDIDVSDIDISLSTKRSSTIDDKDGRVRSLPSKQRAYGLKGISASVQTVGSRSSSAGDTAGVDQSTSSSGKGKGIVQFARRLFGLRTSDSTVNSPAPVNLGSSDNKKLGLLAQARKYQRSVQMIQNRLGDVCDVVEQFDVVMSWQDYRRSVLVLKVMLGISLILILLPPRLVLLVAGLVQFTAFFRKPKGTKVKNRNLPERLILSAPREGDLEISEDSLHPLLRRK